MRNKTGLVAYPDELLDFSKFNDEGSERIEVGLAELQKNITRLLPGFLEDEADILSDEKLKKRLKERWKSIDEGTTIHESAWGRKEAEKTGFQKRLSETMTIQQF